MEKWLDTNHVWFPCMKNKNLPNGLLILTEKTNEFSFFDDDEHDIYSVNFPELNSITQLASNLWMVLSKFWSKKSWKVIAHGSSTWVFYELLLLIRADKKQLPEMVIISCFPSPTLPSANFLWTGLKDHSEGIKKIFDYKLKNRQSFETISATLIWSKFDRWTRQDMMNKWMEVFPSTIDKQIFNHSPSSINDDTEVRFIWIRLIKKCIRTDGLKCNYMWSSEDYI